MLGVEFLQKGIKFWRKTGGRDEAKRTDRRGLTSTTLQVAHLSPMVGAEVNAATRMMVTSMRMSNLLIASLSSISSRPRCQMRPILRDHVSLNVQ